MITAEQVQEVIDDSRYKIEQIECDQRQFLAKCGWKHTCSTPGSIWLFEKTIPDGRTILVDQSTALFMQSWISPPSEVDDNETDDES